MSLPKLLMAALLTGALSFTACSDSSDSKADAGDTGKRDGGKGDAGESDTGDEEEWDANIPSEPIDDGVTFSVPEDEHVLLFTGVDIDSFFDKGAQVTEIFRANPDAPENPAVQITPYGFNRSPTDNHDVATRSPTDPSLIAIQSGAAFPVVNSASAPFRGNIYLINADGSNKRRLTDAPVSETGGGKTCSELLPFFSYDGEWIYFWRTCTFVQQTGVPANVEYMYRIRTNGEDEQLLVDPDLKSPTDPSKTIYMVFAFGGLSRDGTKLFVKSSEGNSANISQLYVMDLTQPKSPVGFQATHLTTFDALSDEDGEGGYQGYVHQAIMVQANNKLLYQLKLHKTVTGVGDVVKWYLEERDPDGSNPKRVRTIPSSGRAGNLQSAFTLDYTGTRVAYFTCEHALDEEGYCTGLQPAISDINGENEKLFTPKFYGTRWIHWD